MSNIFENMLKNYDDSHKPRTSNAKKYDLKNYFSTYLDKGINSAIKQIRILPPSQGSELPWVIKHGHKVQVDGAWKTFACLKHENDEPCPFCEAREVLLSSGDSDDKETAKKYSPRKMYVLKVIDRNNESEGVKFWRFNHDYRKTGTMDALMGAIRNAKHDITDSENGRDIIINIARDMNNRPVINSINCDLNVTKLNDDPGLATDWLSDERTWRDVYSVRDYDYLTIVVKGETPVYSKDKGKFVSKESLEIAHANEKPKEDFDSELTMGNFSQKKVDDVKTVTNVNTPITEDDDDDLPF